MERKVAVEEGHAEEKTQEEEEDPLSGLMRAVRDPVLGFEVRDRSYHLKTYPACFVGLPPSLCTLYSSTGRLIIFCFIP